MPSIHQLPPSVVNKIAAGEVIERPASVVKELVENALDAGATRIEVALVQGGVELVRVVDNGGGIPRDELPLAVASHATSKLATADDLFRVETLGFRGEALASIAEISRFTLRSRPAGATAGAELEVAAGVVGEVAPCGCPEGTIIEVRNLFFNTPVRRKFLRSTQTEMGHVSEAFTRLALAHPQVHFTLKHNDRAVYDLAPCQDWRERIDSFFGHELAASLIWIESQDPPVRLAGFVAHPSHSRGNARMQYLFLNGRSIRDRSLQHALAEAYRGLLLTGRYPISFLCFDMPPEMVDVNVHPTKLEVRFQDGGRLYSQLLGTIRTKFLTTDLTHALTATGATTSGGPRAADSLPAAGGPHGAQEVVAWAKAELVARLAAHPPEQAPGAVAAEAAAGNGMDRPATVANAHGPLELYPLDRAWQPVGGPEEAEPGGSQWPDVPPVVGGLDWGAAPAPWARVPRQATAEASWGLRPGVPGEPHFHPAPVASAVQIHNRYLVTESAEGVLVIDQHALHERILYEQLRAKVLAGALETQNLLVPEPVDLSPAEAAAALDERELLAQLGLRIEPFGGGTVLVSSYPAMLAGSSAGQLLRDLVELLLAERRAPDRRDLVDELLHMMSCKAAVKAGDRLTGEEIAALLEQRHLAQDTHHCPHGRPTALVFTREDLDRQFKRT
ncbi:MAG: DNA mismatch repair endonuclease MutL [Planctomycetia bacterium]|nr:DNA mismatch repair endonuclease MutL [Planctomycetia bacterium]